MDPKTAQYLSSSFGNKGLCMGLILQLTYYKSI